MRKLVKFERGWEKINKVREIERMDKVWEIRRKVENVWERNFQF